MKWSWRQGYRWSLVVATASGAAGCGSRSDLRPAPSCQIQGEQRTCVGVCGEGVTSCVDGFWTECAIPSVVESCESACGTGQRVCEDEQWGACVVPLVEEPCENECGVGIQTCIDGVRSGCQVEPVERECANKCGSGTEVCADGRWGACSAPQPLPPVLQAVVRDFRDEHPDFESEAAGLDQGIVQPQLGPDGKPVYAGGPSGTLTTSGPGAFNQWYRDVPGVNQSTVVELPLTRSALDSRLFSYEGSDFFPIDGQLFGNQGRMHNYHFTLEASGTFVYQGGETFRFTGDDDVWVFVNGQLVIDIGGLHQSLTEIVSLDDVAGALGLEVGSEYPLHIFFAERKTVESNFNIETSIAGLGECPEP